MGLSFHNYHLESIKWKWAGVTLFLTKHCKFKKIDLKFSVCKTHAQLIFEMPIEEPLLNSIKCLAKSLKCPARLKKFSWTLEILCLFYHNKFTCPVSFNIFRGIVSNKTIWDRLVFAKVQASLGGRCRVIVTGSAPLAPKVLDFMRCASGAVVRKFCNIGFPTCGHRPRSRCLHVQYIINFPAFIIS